MQSITIQQLRGQNYAYQDLWGLLRVVAMCGLMAKKRWETLKLSISYRSLILWWSSCFLAASNPFLLVLNSFSIECRCAWVTKSTFWMVYIWSWSWVTDKEVYANEVPKMESLDLDGLSNIDAPSLSSMYIVPFSLQVPQDLKKMWLSASICIYTLILMSSCLYFSYIIRKIKNSNE